ncbi:protein-L-isoaspartate(D-aspartate) O-methyltransferase [Streptomyces narbonensis]|uniref:protein-L-isoaspartate(D-aspartate) O-methyltransferase n=1 Tax=Streptomyces narbonensis TaxID=67333 RepID=UPI0033FDE7D6
MSDDEALREAMVDRLAADGHLRSPRWRQAVLDTPRHKFLRGGHFRRVDGSGATGWEPVMPGDPAWLPAAYSDDSLVTQVAGTIVPGDIRGRILRAPTSSSTMPGLVVRMLEELQVDDGMRVLEIGTGTGYSTALLCHRLGDGLVTSVEVDADVSTRARTALGTVGHLPRLVVGDGLAGDPGGGPYDRIVAACGILGIPPAWLAQTRPGGRILATVCGWMYSSELARLTVDDDGTAHGGLLGGRVSSCSPAPTSRRPSGPCPISPTARNARPLSGPTPWTTGPPGSSPSSPRLGLSSSGCPSTTANRAPYSWTSTPGHGRPSTETVVAGSSAKAVRTASGTGSRTTCPTGSGTDHRTSTASGSP